MSLNSKILHLWVKYSHRPSLLRLHGKKLHSIQQEIPVSISKEEQKNQKDYLRFLSNL